MRKPKTFTTLECVAREVRRAKTVEDAVEFLSAYVGRVIVNTSAQTHAENRRLRGEVRRLRRDARLYRKMLRTLSAWLKMTGRDLELDLTAAKYIDAALAPRRRKKP